AGKQIVLCVESIHAKSNMVHSPNQVHIIGKLVARDIEVARRTGSATHVEAGIGHAKPEIVRYQRIDVDAESLGVKKVRIRPAEIRTPGKRRVERVERSGSESKGVADRRRLRTFIIAGTGGHQYVRGVEKGGL